MKIYLNGERFDCSVENVAGLITEIGLDSSKIAVERNLEIVPRSAWITTGLAEGDRIEIVHFVGGGA